MNLLMFVTLLAMSQYPRADIDASWEIEVQCTRLVNTKGFPVHRTSVQSPSKAQLEFESLGCCYNDEQPEPQGC